MIILLIENNIHFVQLNNDTTWNFRVFKAILTTVFKIYYNKALDWLESDLEMAYDQGQVIIINIHNSLETEFQKAQV